MHAASAEEGLLAWHPPAAERRMVRTAPLREAQAAPPMRDPPGRPRAVAARQTRGAQTVRSLAAWVEARSAAQPMAEVPPAERLPGPELPVARPAAVLTARGPLARGR